MNALKSKKYAGQHIALNPAFAYTHSTQTSIQDSPAWKAAIAARDQVRDSQNVREMRRKAK
jgi:hypothetical protein